MPLRIRECTPTGAGGVSVLSVEGAGALDLVETWTGRSLAAGELRLVRLAIAGEALDEALVCVFSAERLELHVHGSPPLVRTLLRAVESSASAALTVSIEERAHALLANAAGELAARVLLDQAEGALRRELAGMLVLADDERQERSAQLYERSRSLRFLFHPPRVLIAGPVNAGKSTLFNLLVGEERAITSDQAGTTRDLLQEPAQIGDWPVLLSDSAGLRTVQASDAQASVEALGQSFARRAASSADLVLWLEPTGNSKASFDSQTRQALIPSRGDLHPQDADRIRPLEDPAGARKCIELALVRALDLPEPIWTPGAAVVFDEPGFALLEVLAQSPGEKGSRALEAQLAKAPSGPHG